MAQFSVELRRVIDSGVDIFNFDYPLYDQAYKETLEQKIIKHYYYSELGFETVGRFIDRLDAKMNEIMPKYNIMYKSLSDKPIDLQITKSSDMVKTGTHVNDVDKLDTTVLDDDTTNIASSVVDSDSSDVVANSQKFSDTPQGRTDLSNTDYLTELTEEDNSVTSSLDSTTTTNVTGTQDTTTTLTATEDSTLTVNETESYSESDKTQAELLEVFRQQYNDVDMLIIEDLADLFMLIY